MRSQQHRSSARQKLRDMQRAFSGEGFVPDGENLVRDKDLRMTRDRQTVAEPQAHARRVGPQGLGPMPWKLRKTTDFRNTILQQIAGDPLQKQGGPRIFLAGPLVHQTGRQIQQAGDRAAPLHATRGGLAEAGRKPQERALSGTVLANHAESLAWPQIEGHIVQGEATVILGGAAPQTSQARPEGKGLGNSDGLDSGRSDAGQRILSRQSR